MSHALRRQRRWRGRIEVISGGLRSGSNFAKSLHQMAPFFAAAMRAPAPTRLGQRERPE